MMSWAAFLSSISLPVRSETKTVLRAIDPPCWGGLFYPTVGDAQSSAQDKACDEHEFTFIAPFAGRWTPLFHSTCSSETISYEFTADVSNSPPPRFSEKSRSVVTAER